MLSVAHAVPIPRTPRNGSFGGQDLGSHWSAIAISSQAAMMPLPTVLVHRPRRRGGEEGQTEGKKIDSIQQMLQHETRLERTVRQRHVQRLQKYHLDRQLSRRSPSFPPRLSEDCSTTARGERLRHYFEPAAVVW